jgi:hypothetical protein
MNALNAASKWLRRTAESLSPGAAARREAEEYRLKLAADRRAEDLRWLMTTPQGRRVVYQLMVEGRQQGSTYHPDKRLTERMEGARDLVCRLADEVSKADPDGWMRMLAEARHANSAS